MSPRYCVQKQDHGLADILDNTLVELCKAAIEKGEKVKLDLVIRNINRTTSDSALEQDREDVRARTGCRKTRSRLSSPVRLANRLGRSLRKASR